MLAAGIANPSSELDSCILQGLYVAIYGDTEDDTYMLKVDMSGTANPPSTRVRINANHIDVAHLSGPYWNPMGGHANGNDIHPYSIRLLPILIY